MQKKTPATVAGVLTCSSGIRLEDYLQAKFDLPRRTEREHSSACADPVREMPSVIRAVDAACRTGQQAGHHARRQVKIDKVEQVIGADGRFDGHPLLDVIAPSEGGIEGL